MLSAVGTVLLFSVMLLIVASFMIGIVRERQRHIAAHARWAQLPSHALDRHVKVVLLMQEGNVVDVAEPAPVLMLPPAWYRRRRILLSLGFLLMLLLALCVQGGLVGDTWQRLQGLGISLFGDVQTANLQATGHAILYGNASQRLARIYQLDPGQYATPGDYNTWAYSACSTAAMTEVFNAYGAHLRIADVLKVEAQIGAITPALGLTDPSGIEHTAAQFGFTTNWGTSWTLDQVIAVANSGKPVIVNFPPDRYAGGHLLVVIGGDANNVYLADSSLWNRQSITRAQFLQWWEGFAAVVTPH